MDAFIAGSGVFFDTARIYANGKSEEMTGRIMSKSPAKYAGLSFATKAHPSQPGGLSEEGIRGQLKASLEALQMSQVDTFYLHQPDTNNALTESLRTVNELIKAGTVKSYGLSNYSTVEVERVIKICKDESYPLPEVYQGLYNPINRRVEKELLPVLRSNGIAFVAYNPLAGGMLTGKHSREDGEVPKGRFHKNKNYSDRFYKPDVFDAVDKINAACKEADISIVQATYSWMMHHSKLGSKGDGILLGASTIEQLEQNLKCCNESAPLPTGILEAFDEGWAICEPDAFAFWRSYSLDQPGRDTMDPGAAYVAGKK